MTKNEARNDYLRASGERDLYTSDSTADSDSNITGLIILIVLCAIVMIVSFIPFILAGA